MRHSVLLGLSLGAALGAGSGCEPEPPSGIGTAEFHPGTTGGDAGTGGTGASPGSGGAGAETSDATAGAAGSPAGGTAGAFGAAGTGAGPAGLFRCAEACDQDSDCTSALPDQSLHCSRSRGRCEGFAAPCQADAECIPAAS